VTSVRRLTAPLGGSWGAVVLGAVAYVVLLALAHVGPAASCGYLGYELAFVGLPGLIGYLAVTGVQTLGARELAVGWGVGLALELAAFSLTAWAGIRVAFDAYPAVVVLGAAPFVRVRLRRRARDRARWPWWLLAFGALLVGWIANALLAAPLPSETSSVKGYANDLLWTTSVTGEALHHWPVQIPDLAGVPLHYHYFSFLDLAAAAQVTGLQPWWIVFRLFPVVAAAVLVLQLFAVGTALGRRISVGVAAVFLYLLAGRFFPWGAPSTDVVTQLWISPSFSFGLMLLLASLAELDRLVREPGRRAAWSGVALLAVLGFATTGAKVPAGVVLLGTTLALLAYAALRRRDAIPRLAAAVLVLAAGFVVVWVDVLRGGPGGGTNFDPFGVVRLTQPYHAIFDRVPHPLGEVVLAAGALLGALKLTAPLLPGLIAARVEPQVRTLGLGALGLGLALYFAYFNVGSSEAYFLWYGLAPGAVLAAVGWDQLIRARIQPGSFDGRVVAVGALLLIALWAVDLPQQSSSPQWWSNLGHTRVDEPEYVGLRWLADHTAARDVIAVDQRADPMSCYVTAFSERRALNGCYLGVVQEKLFGSPEQLRALLSPQIFAAYRRRARLHDAIFAGDPSAARAAARFFGVRYVVFLGASSGRTRPAVVRLKPIARTVFENSQVTILRLSPM